MAACQFRLPLFLQIISRIHVVFNIFAMFVGTGILFGTISLIRNITNEKCNVSVIYFYRPHLMEGNVFSHGGLSACYYVPCFLPTILYPLHTRRKGGQRQEHFCLIVCICETCKIFLVKSVCVCHSVPCFLFYFLQSNHCVSPTQNKESSQHVLPSFVVLVIVVQIQCSLACSLSDFDEVKLTMCYNCISSFLKSAPNCTLYITPHRQCFS